MAQAPSPRAYSALDVFQSAMQFNAACHYMTGVNHKTDMATAALIGNPIIAMSALTIELLLKTLHAMHSSNPVPQIHPLDRLFDGLDQSSKRDVQACWDPIFTIWHDRWDQIRRMALGPNVTPLTASVREALEAGSLAFEQNRYTFEAKRGNYYVDHLREPMIEMIIRRRPEWGQGQVRASSMSWEELARLHAEKSGGKPA